MSIDEIVGLKCKIYGRRIDAPSDKRGQSFLRAAQLQQRHVLHGIEAGVLEHDAENERRFAAEPVDADFFSSELRQIVDLFPRRHRIGNEVIPTPE